MMAAKHASAAGAAGDGSSPAPVTTTKQSSRFSLLSLLTNNQSSRSASFRNKKQKNNKKSSNKSKIPTDSTVSVPSVSDGSAISGVSAVTTATDSTVPPPSRCRIDSATGIELRECPLCYDELSSSSFPDLNLTCGHKSCAGCMEEYLKIEIGESRIDISCPECKERLHPADIQQLLKSDTTYINKYEEFMVRRVLVTDPDTRWCPAPDCGYAVIAAGCAGCPLIRCQRPGCGADFCYHCKQEWHPNQTCEAARRERFPTEIRISLSDIQTLARTVEEYKSCPRCKTMINKMDDGSCNHMTCSICGAQFCWLCLKEASDLHYLSPSGCTFWGKKPWSKKKKILWQLGTLIGAPVGIALIAGLSVPVLIFGLPIWTGRKLYQKFKRANKHKRNVIVTFGTVAAFLASPVLAGVTIAIGVPVMLAYVYGVVPYSLCRGGTCGVKNEGGTLSFDFSSNNSEEQAGGVGRTNDPFLVANPSIGPSIGENSLAAGFGLSASGIHMNTVGLTDDQSDTKSASMKNMVGTSITGSIYEPESSYPHQRWEIRADVSLRPTAGTERKNSIDSQTLSQFDNRSLRSFGPADNRSHVSFNVENTSTKASVDSMSVANSSVILPPQESTYYDAPSKSCMRGDHGSPVSNRSVSFAAHDGKSKAKKKPSKRRRGGDADKADRLSSRGSFDTVSSSSSNDVVPVSKRSADLKQRPSLQSQNKSTSLESTTLENSSVTASEPLTEIEVDKPQQHQFSTVVIRQTVTCTNTSKSTVPTSQLIEGKVLCNILEDNGVAS